MKVTRSSTGLVVRMGPGLETYVLGFAALWPLWVVLAEGSISRAHLPGVLVVPAVSLLLMSIFVEVAEYKFSPVTQSLHWWKRGAFGRSEGTVAMGDIEELRVASRQSREDGNFLHSILITARGRTIAFRRGMATGAQRHHAVADAIVGYLAELGYHPRYVTEEPGTRSSKPPDRTSRLILPWRR